MKTATTADRLRDILQKKGLKQIELYELCLPIAARYGVKINKSNISQYVNGLVEPNQDKLVVLSEALHVSPTWLMGYDEPSGPVSREEVSKYFETFPVKTSHPIPIIGTVRCGVGGLAYEDRDGYEMEDVNNPEEYYELRVKGDSMEPRIHEGDLALIHIQDDVESGDIGVVIVNGEEGVLKKVIKKEGVVVLMSFNQAYEPRLFAGLDMNRLRFAGKLVKTTTRW